MVQAADALNDEYAVLLRTYIAVCNKAILAHKDHFPYCEIWKGALDQLQGKELEFGIWDDRPKVMVSLRIGQNSLEGDADPVEPLDLSVAHSVSDGARPNVASGRSARGMTISPCAKGDGQCWVFPYSFLNLVAQDPDFYIRNPAKLDWSWLRLKSSHD